MRSGQNQQSRQQKPEDKIEADKIRIDLVNVPIFNENRRSQLEDDLGLEAVSPEKLSAVEMFLSRVEKLRDKDDKYLKLVENGPDGGQIEFDAPKVLNEIGALTKKHFDDQPDLMKNVLAKHQQMLGEEAEFDQNGDDEEKYLAEFKRAAWLLGQLEFLQQLDDAQKLVDESKKINERIKNAKDPKKAGADYDIRDAILTNTLHKTFKTKPNQKTPDRFYSPAAIGRENAEERNLREFKNAVARHKQNFVQAFNEGEVDKKNLGEEGKKADHDFSKDLPADIARYAKHIGRMAAHPLLKGILTSSNPTESSKWQDFGRYRDKLLANVSLNNEAMKGQLERLRSEYESGLLSEEEFKQFIEMNKKQAEDSDKKHQEYLDSLQKAAIEANEAILKKIEEDQISGDELNKYRLVQIILLFSPFLPIPIAGILFNALQPFLSGALDIPNFLGSFFSVDGPFRQVAWLTDKMGIDDAVKAVLNLFNGPLDVINKLVVNDITSPIMQSVGAGVVGSPLSGLVLATGFEVITGHLQKEFKRLEKSEDILAKAKADFNEAYHKIRDEEIERAKKQKQKFVEDEIELRKDLFVAGEASNWLMQRYFSSPKSCEMLLKNLFGYESQKLIKALQENGNVLENLYKLRDEDGFKTLLEFRQAEIEGDKTSVDKIFNFDSKILQVNNRAEQLKAQYNFNASVAEDNKKPVIKITDILTADGQQPKPGYSDFVDAANSSLQDFIIELNVEGEKYLSIDNNNPNALSILQELFEINSTPQKLDKLNKEQKTVLDSTNKDPKGKKIFDGAKINEDLKKCDFYFAEADKLGIEHNYFPKQGLQFLKKELEIDMKDAEEGGFRIYSEIADNASNEEKMAHSNKMLDRMVLMLSLFKDDPDLYDDILDASYREEDFDFDEFLIDAGIDKDRQRFLVKNHKQFLLDQQIVLQDYLKENEDIDPEVCMETISSIFKSNQEMRDEAMRIEKKYIVGEKKMAEILMPIAVAVDEHYTNAFNAAKYKSPKNQEAAPQENELSDTELEDSDTELEDDTLRTRINNGRRSGGATPNR